MVHAILGISSHFLADHMAETRDDEVKKFDTSVSKKLVTFVLNSLGLDFDMLVTSLRATTHYHNSLPCALVSGTLKLDTRQHLLLHLQHMWRLRLLGP